MSIVPPHDPMDPTAPRLTDLEPEAEAPPFLNPEAADERPVAARHIEGRSPWVLAWQRLRRDRVAMVSLVVIGLIILLAIFAPVTTAITGHPPNEQYRETGLSADGLPLPRTRPSGSAPTTSGATSSSGSPTARGSRCSSESPQRS